MGGGRFPSTDSNIEADVYDSDDPCAFKGRLKTPRTEAQVQEQYCQGSIGQAVAALLVAPALSVLLHNRYRHPGLIPST